VLEQGFGIGAVAPVSIQREGPAARGISDENAAGVDPPESASDGAGGIGHGHLREKRIAAAGADQDDLETAGARQRTDHRMKANGLELHVGIAAQYGIHGTQVVRVFNLHPVAREIDQRDVGVFRSLGKVPKRQPLLSLVHIHAHRDVKSKPTESSCEIPGVIGRTRDVGH
jgi:hypothetical protein